METAMHPYLTFDGQCEAAFRFYEACLGGKITCLLTYGESPIAKQAPSEWGNKVLHATLVKGPYTLGGADVLPEQYRKPQGFSVALMIDTPAEAERVFNALAEKGTVQMPLQETFWAAQFGMLVDQFGTPWMINCGRP
jgi:PhnB protein